MVQNSRMPNLLFGKVLDQRLEIFIFFDDEGELDLACVPFNDKLDIAQKSLMGLLVVGGGYYIL